MELTLTVQPPAAPAVDVDMSVEAGRPVRDLVDALVRATGVPSSLSQDMSLYIPLRDAWLNNDMAVSQARLRVGEVVVLGRNVSNTSVAIGDIVEKTHSAQKTKSSASSPFELCVVSGSGNGTRFSLTAQSLVIVDRRGNVRVSDARPMVRKNPEGREQDFAAQGKPPRFDFEGVSQLDAGACLIECDRKIFLSPVSGETNVEVRKINERTELDEHAMIVCGGVQLFVRHKVVDEPLNVSERGLVGINRPPRDMQPPMERIISIQAPPRDAQKARISPVMVIIPLVFGIGMALLLNNPMFLGFALMSPVMMIGQSLDSKRTGKKEYKQGKAKYVSDIDNAVQQLRIGRREELAVRRIVFPDATDCVSRVLDGRHDLWDRRRDDIDFLAFRIGVGDQAALVSATIESGGSEDLRDYGERKLRRTDPLRLAPLAIPLPEYGAIGLVGAREQTREVLMWLMLQTVTLHSHRDVSICAALPLESSTNFEFLKWMPHVRHGGAEIDEPTIAFGDDKAVVLFQKLRALIDARIANSKNVYQDSSLQWPSVVVFIDETVVRERTMIDAILKQGPAAGVFVVFLASQFRDLPGECRAVVDVAVSPQAEASVSVSYPGSGQAPITCGREAVCLSLVNDVAQMIASMRDMTASMASGGGGSLPKGVRLLDILELTNPTPDDLIQRWNNPPESLQATLGVTTDGVMRIDLRQDGPHALVAGTTGSGKSELLQTFVASIASNYSPEKVNFLFVDYKGGSAFADCSVIPHSVGMVTDLDEYLAQRVLVSLNAELKRREALLREYGAKDLIVLEKRFPAQCPPSLMIVIDEFAALVREVPDFVEGVVDIAQRGRSLGLHLILATQRPAGVINDNIRANTNLRIALRIADSSDSTDVIGTDEAARIPRTIPGRAFVRMGPSELQAFQTGYGGDFTVTAVKSDTEDGTQELHSEAIRQPIVVEPFSLFNIIEVSDEDDLEVILTEERDDEEDNSAMTDLRYLCNVISETAKILHLDPPRQPWKEPLAHVIPLHTIGDMSLLDSDDPGRRVVLGVIDLPQMQDQQTYTHDFESDGNLFIYGTSSSGKTTTLRTIAGSLAVAASPNDVVIYAIDCASGGLECLRGLPHCASVITSRDAEGMSHFLARMTSETEMRKELFRREGVASLGEFRTRMRNNGMTPSVPLPRIVVLLDSFAGFNSAFEKVEYGVWIDQVQRLTAEGRPLGIHLVITADRRGAIPFNMAGLVEQKLVMRMADADELSSLGVPHKIAKEIKLTPGRALLRGELEIQIPTVSDEPDGASQATQLIKIAQHLVKVYGETQVSRVPSLPERVSLAELPHGGDNLHALLGVAVSEIGLAPCGVDLSRGHFLISGGRETGKSTALVSLIHSLNAKENPPVMFVFTPRPNFISSLPHVHNIAVGTIACEEQLNELVEASQQMDEESPEIVLIIDDCEDLAEGTFAYTLESLMGEMKQKLHVVAAGDPSAFARAYSGWIAEVKKPKSGLLFKPDPATDGEITGVKLRILPGQTFPPGRGFLCLDRQSILMQVGM
ncbi:MAG TPA: FtsK/SpoIIIE domain-containing protein [Acidimicrobiia bacterium]|nr:FtsK/SpoIIIE domain-containing protein [Acidimicrobiia bacterium]